MPIGRIPFVGPVTPHIIHAWSSCSINSRIVGSSTTSAVPSGSAVWPAANDALFFPFIIYEQVDVKRLWVANGSVVSGNFDIGIYTEDATKLVSTGATAQSGTSTIQTVTVAYTLGPGLYFAGLAIDNITATVTRQATVDIQLCKAIGMFKQETAYTLPAVATFATVTAAYIPLFGLGLQTV